MHEDGTSIHEVRWLPSDPARSLLKTDTNETGRLRHVALTVDWCSCRERNVHLSRFAELLPRPAWSERRALLDRV